MISISIQLCWEVVERVEQKINRELSALYYYCITFGVHPSRSDSILIHFKTVQWHKVLHFPFKTRSTTKTCCLGLRPKASHQILLESIFFRPPRRGGASCNTSRQS
jgi:hypothetical protein